jgi:signal transduction histidine kinase/ActR/RegA family two-component response regulator
MTAPTGFALAQLAPHQLAAIAARIRSATCEPAPFDAIATAILDALWGSLEERTPPQLAMTGVFRVRGCSGPPEQRTCELAAWRVMDEWRNRGPNDERQPIVARLVETLARGANEVVLVPQAVGNPLVSGQSELVARYGVKAAIATSGCITPDEGFVLAVFSRVAIDPALANSFGVVGLAASLALSRANDLAASPEVVLGERSATYERLLGAVDHLMIDHAATLATRLATEVRRGEELTKKLATLSDEEALRRQRAQRAMLNVIEDLREAHQKLEERVTERTSQLEHAHRDAQLANQAKDEFLAMLGHELRNPLAPIVTALELMELRGGDAMKRERTIIERQTQHLSVLVDDLLDVSRIARGIVKLEIERVRLADVIAKAVETTEPLFAQQGHELAVTVPHDLAVNGDPARLAQVFANLLSNAAKYTDPGGKVTVTASAHEDEIAIAVADNGRGIEPEMLPRVWDPFVQEHQKIDRSRGGLGLGLAIVRNLIKLHGGRIEGASAGLGQGSTFTVYLHRADQVPAEIPRPAGTAPQYRAQGVSVLVVDDNRDAAEMLAMLLESRGYTTYVAHDPVEALELAHEYVPDAAVLDLGLPVMDGYELARRLRALPNWAHVKLLALTGYGQDVDRVRSKDAGFAEHLVKPVDLGTLERHLRPPPAQMAQNS